MRSFTSSRPVWSASRISRASPTSSVSSERVPHGISSTVSSQVRIHPCSGLCSLVRSSRSTSRSTATRTSSGSTSSLELRAVLGDRVVGVAALAQLLADRGELLAQQELALRLVHALGDAAADLLRQVELGQRLAHEVQRLLQARLGVELLEQLHLALDRRGRAPSPRCRRARPGRRPRRGRRRCGGCPASRRCRARRRGTRGPSPWPDRSRPRARPRGRPRPRGRGGRSGRCGRRRRGTGRAAPAPAGHRAARPRSRRGRRCRPGCSRCRRAGTRRTRRSPAMAPSAASRASAVSSASVTTICGRTTPVVRGSSGRFRVVGVGHREVSLQWVITPLREILNHLAAGCIPESKGRVFHRHTSETAPFCARGRSASEQVVLAHPGDGAGQTVVREMGS